MTRLARAAAVAVAAVLLAGACTAVEPADEPEPDPGSVEPAEPRDTSGPRLGGTLRIGLSTDPASLDPRFVVDEAGELIVDALFDPLVRVGPDGELVPAAAESWEVDETGQEFRFHLRQATFHDGSAVTAEDFARSFDRIADGTATPVSFLAYVLEAVEGFEAAQTVGASLSGIEVVDERVLTIRLAEPDPGFLTALTHPSLVPLPPTADDDLVAFAAQPVGNGAFAMAGPREPGAFVRLSRFGEHREPPLLDEVVLTIYGDARGLERQWNDLLDGQLHVADLPPEYQDEAITRFGRSLDGYRGPGVLNGITSTIYAYGLDTTVAPYDDVRVRRALSLSLDRDALAEEIMQGTRAPATAIVPPSLPGSQPGVCEYCRHDPDAAAALLDEVRAEAASPHVEGDGDTQGEAPENEQAGDEQAEDEQAGEAPADPVDRPPPEAEVPPVLERITLTHTRGDTHVAIAERMAADIASALDIDVDFQARDLQTYTQSIRSGEVPVFRLGWEATVPDPGAYLYPLFHSSQVGSDNMMGYVDEEVDALLDAARATPGDRARLATYREAERLIAEDLPIIPLLWYRHSTVVAPEAQDLVYSPLGQMNLERVWLDPEAGST